MATVKIQVQVNEKRDFSKYVHLIAAFHFLCSLILLGLELLGTMLPN